MENQVLNESERRKIRSEIYTESTNQPFDVTDPKIEFFVSRIKGKRVLDLGSIDHFEGNWKSRYWLFKALLANAGYAKGLDYYKAGVEVLKGEGFPIEYGDAQDFHLNERFDVVTAGDLIEHLPNLTGFINSVDEHLNDGGSLILSTPNVWCWKYFGYHVLRGRLDRVNGEHICWFCIETLANLFKRHGFSLKEYAYCSRRGYEKLIPLPAHIKHTTLNAVFVKDSVA